MWICPNCRRNFKHKHQSHFCSDQGFTDFVVRKNPAMVDLLIHFITKLEEIGPVQLNTTKTMIVIANKDHKIAYVLNIGKLFVDVVFSFKQAYHSNLCFRKIALVPGTSDYNHHLRLMYADDVNEEVLGFMKLAYGENL